MAKRAKSKFEERRKEEGGRKERKEETLFFPPKQIKLKKILPHRVLEPRQTEKRRGQFSKERDLRHTHPTQNARALSSPQRNKRKREEHKRDEERKSEGVFLFFFFL